MPEIRIRSSHIIIVMWVDPLAARPPGGGSTDRSTRLAIFRTVTLTGRMTENADDWPEGYVLRGGGPLNGVIVHNRRRAFVAIEYSDGPRDLYRPSGKPDIELPKLERYDYEEIEK
jgi:hypothetical protein